MTGRLHSIRTISRLFNIRTISRLFNIRTISRLLNILTFSSRLLSSSKRNLSRAQPEGPSVLSVSVSVTVCATL